MSERRRGLGEVLHYFISEQEQHEARGGGPPRRAGPRRGRVRWALCFEPARPLCSALAIDLASAMGTCGAATEILSPLAPPFPFAGDAGRPWRRLASPWEADAALRRVGPGSGALLVLSGHSIGTWLSQVSGLDGILIPVDAAERGLPTALGLLHALPRPAPSARIAALVLGAEGEGARRLYERLADAAARRLDLRLESLGSVPHDRASFLSLLRGRPAEEIDAGAASVRGVRDVSRRLCA